MHISFTVMCLLILFKLFNEFYSCKTYFIDFTSSSLHTTRVSIYMILKKNEKSTWKPSNALHTIERKKKYCVVAVIWRLHISPLLFTLPFLYKDKKLQHHQKFHGTLFIKEHSKNNSASYSKHFERNNINL